MSNPIKNSNFMKMEYGIVLRTDGTIKILMPDNGTDFQLAELQKVVEGYIELIHFSPHYFMVVNEEGLLKKLPLNNLASSLRGYAIYGNVLLCDKSMIK
jgi:hypothetical protein